MVSAYFIIRNFVARPYSATLELDFTPIDSIAMANDYDLKQGINKLKPGTYTIKITRNDFEGFSKKITVKEGETSYVGAVLKANTKTSFGWYNNPLHNEDMILAEKISSRLIDEASKDVTTRHPLDAILPYDAPRYAYKIWVSDYDSDNNPVVTISKTTNQSEADARQWLNSRGFNPTNTKILVEHLTPPIDYTPYE